MGEKIRRYASDPRKMADFRAFSAVRNKCLHEGWCSLDDYRVFNASRFLLKLAEHTWGIYGIGEAAKRKAQWVWCRFSDQLAFFVCV